MPVQCYDVCVWWLTGMVHDQKHSQCGSTQTTGTEHGCRNSTVWPLHDPILTGLLIHSDDVGIEWCTFITDTSTYGG